MSLGFYYDSTWQHTLGTKKCETCQAKGYVIVKSQPPQKSNVSNVIVGYHQTNPESAQQILQKGFQCGSCGIAGGGIYFAMNPNDTNFKARSKGVILKAHVDVGACKILNCFNPGLNGEKLKQEGFDSVFLPTGDGINLNSNEYVVYDPSKVKNIVKYC